MATEFDRGDRTLVVIKKDAIDEGIDAAVVAHLSTQDDIEIIANNPVEFTAEDVLRIYEPELVQDPCERREILMAMAATAMEGPNRLVTVRVNGAEDIHQAFVRLRNLKGSIKDSPADGTVRGVFPFQRPPNYDNLSFWFQAPFFTKNRIHIPDSPEALSIVETVAIQRGLEYSSLYPPHN